jgi:hypothetical protein
MAAPKNMETKGKGVARVALQLRIPEALYQSLNEAKAGDGVALNVWCVSALEFALAAWENEKHCEGWRPREGGVA